MKSSLAEAGLSYTGELKKRGFCKKVKAHSANLRKKKWLVGALMKRSIHENKQLLFLRLPPWQVPQPRRARKKFRQKSEKKIGKKLKNRKGLVVLVRKSTKNRY